MTAIKGFAHLDATTGALVSSEIPNLGVASATSLATSAASPLLMTNGKLVTVALTSQTVNPTTLTIPDFAGVNDTFVFVTLAQTLSNKTFVTPVLGVASATSLATSAASPFLLTNGQLVTVALTSQTVGGTTLTIPNFAHVNDTFVFITLAQTLSNKTFVAPALGAATATSINGLTISTSTGTLTITNLKTLAATASITLGGTDGKTLSVSNNLTLAGTDGTTMTFPGTSATIARTDAANTFTGHQTIEGVTTTGATGTNLLVFGSSPTLVTPTIGDFTNSTHNHTNAANGGTLGYGQSLCGDGSDGVGAADGSTALAGASRSSNTYTLTRDVYYTTLTISTGVNVVTAGYRVFCSVSLVTVGTGNIGWNGVDGSGATAGTALTDAVTGGSSAGGNGGTNGPGSNGSNSQSNSLGGAGGNGGGSGAFSGGTGGTVVAPGASLGGIRNVPEAITGQFIGAGNFGSLGTLHGGAGGGGGASTSIGLAGGGGGGGGGVVIICAPIITNAGTITANGGAGANGNQTGNTGGGGGGGGGVLVLVRNSRTGAGTVTASGGAKGLKGGTGNDGVNGSVGTVIELQN